MLKQIQDEIRTSDTYSISYSEYMSLALYHPSSGYYMTDAVKLGVKGDFYTSSHVHHVFGKVYARLLNDMMKANQLTPAICEIGAGDGTFAAALLTEWNKEYPDENLQYYIIESSPFHRRLQSEKLAFCEKVHQFESLHELKTKIGSFNGIVFSNELFDAFPVDVVTKKDDTFYEIRVSLNENDDLFEVVEPCEKKELTDWLKKRKIEMVEDQRMEIPLAMDQFIIEIGNWIEKGIVITVDYGYVTEQWSKPERKDGSLRGYFNHQLINNPLQRPGEMDLTTHIHFDSLIESAKVADLKLEGFYRQDEFLLKAGILRYLQDHYDPNPFSEISKQNRAVRSLISDQSISSSFHTILQSKGIKFNADDFLLKLDELK